MLYQRSGMSLSLSRIFFGIGKSLLDSGSSICGARQSVSRRGHVLRRESAVEEIPDQL